VAKKECNSSEEIDSVSERMKGQVLVEEDLSPHVQVKEEWGREKRVKVEGENKSEDEKDDEAEYISQPVKVEEHWQNYYPFLQLMMPMHWN
jgi:hypothetical protein